MAFIVWKQQTKQWNDKWTWIAIDRFICATVQRVSPGCTWLQYHSQKSFNKVQRRAEVPWKSSRFICWFVKLDLFIVCFFCRNSTSDSNHGRSSPERPPSPVLVPGILKSNVAFFENLKRNWLGNRSENKLLNDVPFGDAIDDDKQENE